MNARGIDPFHRVLKMVFPSIESLIPHRNRMKLVDEILHVDEKRAVTASTVTDRWPMVEEGSVNSIVLVELVAQTAGVSLGWKEHQKRGEAVEGTGWIVGIKEARFWCSGIPLYSRIITESKKTFQMELYSEIDGKAFLNNETLAEIRLQVIQSGGGQGE